MCRFRRAVAPTCPTSNAPWTCSTCIRRSPAARVTAACVRAGVVFDDLGTYVTDPESPRTAGLVFGFGAVGAALMDAGLAIFADRLRRA